MVFCQTSQEHLKPNTFGILLFRNFIIIIFSKSFHPQLAIASLHASPSCHPLAFAPRITVALALLIPFLRHRLTPWPAR